MSDEEKKALDELWHFDCAYNREIKIVLNLIEKQQKEIEELKKYEKYYEEMEEVNKRFIAVDKIKAKIEDILNSENGEAIEKLIEWQSLLEKE